MKSMKSAPGWNAASASRALTKCKWAMSSNVSPPKRWPRSWADFRSVVMSLRLERVRELLKREIGEVIRRELPVGDVGLINVNDVNVAPNLKNATVFIGVLGGQAQKKRAMEALDKSRKRIQGLLGRAVILKYTPRLRFVLDDSIERGNKVLRILEDLEHPSSTS